MNETEKVTKEQLIEELFILIKDEYVGEVKKGEAVTLKLLNGQKFEISVKEI